VIRLGLAIAEISGMTSFPRLFRLGFWGRVLLIVVSLHLGLIGLAGLRSAHGPDSVRVHPWADNLRIILTHTPRLGMAVPVVLREPLFEVRRSMPETPLPEWSLHILPANLLASILVVAVWLAARQDRRRGRISSVLIDSGAGIVILCLTSLGWVACCLAPSWVVAVAMAGFPVDLALALAPFGPVLGGVGLTLMALGLLWQWGRDARLGHARIAQ